MHWITYFIGLATQFPWLFAGTVGIVVALILSEVLRAVYFPKDWDNTDQWKAIIPIDLFTCFAFTHAIWHFIDRTTGGLMSVGSLAFAILALGIHLFGLRILLKKWPWIAKDFNDGNPPK